MKIDIISYTDAQYAVLTEEQLLEVKSAQTKKNKLEAQLDRVLLKEKQRLIDNGTFLSDLWKLQEEKLRAEYNLEIETIKESLLFYLRFSSKVDLSMLEGLPYVPNYALPYTERYDQVRDAYFTKISDANERMQAFHNDKVAPSYLGESYSVLYEYIYHFTQL